MKASRSHAHSLSASTGAEADPVRLSAHHLWAADALVHPALYEPFGLVVLEAMAAGLPVFASERTGAAHALVEEGVTGAMRDALDVAGFAEAMAAVAQRSQADRVQTRTACEAAASGYTIDAMRGALEQLYADIAAEVRASDGAPSRVSSTM